MTSSYPKIIALGDKQIAEIFDGPVEITEKIDGSQFGFGLSDGQLVCRSKGKELNLDDPDKMFVEGVEYIKSIQDRLEDGVFFYGEYLRVPRHSTLAYDRIPKNHIALFGALYPDHSIASYEMLQKYAEMFDVDTVPLVSYGVHKAEDVLTMLERESYLGGQQVEGVVVKRPVSWMFLGKVLLPVMAGKYVSERFKETHRADWKKLNTGKGQLAAIQDKYRSEARWHKAIMHLKEAGNFLGSPSDIGNLMKEIKNDLCAEEKENIKGDLWKLFADDILRHATAGFPEWYKESLLKGEIT